MHSVRMSIVLTRRRRVQSGAQPQYFSLVGLHDLESQPVVVHLFARGRHVSGDVVQQSSYSRELLVPVIRKFQMEQLTQLFKRKTATQQQAAVGVTNYIRRGMAVLLA